MEFSSKHRQPILVVDDDPDIRALIRDLLALDGYTVHTARDGREALELMRTLDPRPAVVFLDLMMPDMDGLQFRASQLGETTLAGIPVVVMSGDNQGRQKAEAMHAERFLEKPFDLQTLNDIAGDYSP